MSAVAVIIPLYNKAATVADSIKSVKAQIMGDFECVIIDDGSTDDGVSVAREAIAGDDRFRVFEQENAGVANARNAGVFKYTTAPYIMCLDSDDMIEPGYIAGLLPHLIEDRTLGVVYTRLIALDKNGRRSYSKWPGEFNVEAHFSGQNQVPTAALTTRVMWERLGGQSQRFAPDGAGAEDGDFWLRAASRGFGIKFVSLPEGSLFLYRIHQGLVSGNRNYVQADYKSWSPWCDNHAIMPGPSIYPPLVYSHGIRWYDKPQISVIIPVGGRHIWALDNALDSLDAQTYRNYETIVVFDADRNWWNRAIDSGRLKYIADKWPDCVFTSVAANGKEAREFTSKLDADLQGKSFLEDLPTGDGAGPARARNVGIEISRAPLLFFLDADDWLVQKTLNLMLDRHINSGKIIFSDHIGVATVEPDKLKDVTSGKILAYKERTKEAFIHQRIAEYDCQRAKRQPPTDGTLPYIVCNVSTLVSKSLVKKVGGFDETVLSWEDVLLFWQLAWSGECFERIPEPLLVYRYGTGSMRQVGIRNAKELLAYAQEIRMGYKNMGCGCSGSPVQVQTEASMANGTTQLRLSKGAPLSVNDNELVLIEFDPRNRGKMHRFGMYDFGNGNRINYGPRGGGERFLVHINDLEEEERLARSQNRQPEFVRISRDVSGSKIKETPEPTPVPEPIIASADEEPGHWAQVWSSDDDVPDLAFPEPESGGPTTPLAELDLESLANADRYLAILATKGVVTVADFIKYEEENASIDGIASIPKIGARTREALTEAVQRVL